MKIKSFKCTCGHDDFFFANKGNQTGIFCSECGKWFKWADKDEKNLQLKSPNTAEILDKISAEIDSLEIYASPPRCIEKAKVLEIVEKYKAESEGKE